MKKKKILITIDWFLPGTKSGGPVRSYANMIDHLGAYFDFFVITRDTDYCSDNVYEEIQSNKWNRFNNNCQVFYFSNSNMTIKCMAKVIANTDYDVLLVNGIYSWYFSILPLILGNKTKKTIISARGMLNPQAFSVKPLKKRIFLKLAQLFNLYQGKIFHATNNDEALYIKSLLGQQVFVKIAPNLPRKINEEITIKTGKSTPVRFVNLARISIEKGTLKMIEAFEKINQNVVIDIYGPIYDKNYWERCQVAINRLPDNIKVYYKGVVDSDLVPKLLNQYDYFILFSEGENFGHAILEALSVGCPVLISDKTPWKQLEDRQLGWDINLDNKTLVFESIYKAIEICDLEYNNMTRNALAYAKDFINNPEVLTLNRQLFD